MTDNIYKRFISPDKSKSVTIVYDPDCESPRNTRDLSTKMIVLSEKYNYLGDDHDSTITQRAAPTASWKCMSMIRRSASFSFQRTNAQ